MLPANACPRAQPGPPRAGARPSRSRRAGTRRHPPVPASAPAPPAPLRWHNPSGSLGSRRPPPAAATLPARGLPGEPAQPQPLRPPRHAGPLPRAHLELPQQPQEGQQPGPAARRHRPPAARPQPRLLLLLLLPGREAAVPALRPAGTRPQRGPGAGRGKVSVGAGPRPQSSGSSGVHSPRRRATRTATATRKAAKKPGCSRA